MPLTTNRIMSKTQCNDFFFFLGLHLQHMEVPRLGDESELQLPAYATATAMPDPSFLCNLHHSPWQGGILNPLSKARDGTRIWLLVGFLAMNHSGNSGNSKKEFKTKLQPSFALVPCPVRKFPVWFSPFSVHQEGCYNQKS